MDDDLTDLLNAFPHEPGRINARLIRGTDGREHLQVRVELGVLQMAVDGRPDGGTTVLSERHRLGEPAYAALARLELVQIQQRALAFLSIGDSARALRDAEMVLDGLAAMIRRGPVDEVDWAEGARFSVIVLRTRAVVAGLVAAGRPREAPAAIDAGLALLRGAAERIGLGERFETLGDVQALRTLRETLVPQLPPAQRGELEDRLRAAVRAENYELAAILRDELRRLD
jgi:hypothetical protein